MSTFVETVTWPVDTESMGPFSDLAFADESVGKRFVFQIIKEPCGLDSHRASLCFVKREFTSM